MYYGSITEKIMIGHGIEITTQIGCLNCDYCPQDKLLAAYKSDIKSMSLDTFLRCLDKIPKSVRIHFSGFSEPFLNPDSARMMRVAYERGYSIVVYSTLAGFTEESARLLRDVQFKIFAVHVPDEHTHYHNSVYFSGTELLDKYDIHWFTEPVTTIISRAGNDGSERPIIAGPIHCHENRQLQNVLLPNGDVYLCCMDYGLENRIGNLLTDSYASLFESDVHKRIIAGMKDDSIDILCRKCERAYND